MGDKEAIERFRKLYGDKAVEVLVQYGWVPEHATNPTFVGGTRFWDSSCWGRSAREVWPKKLPTPAPPPPDVGASVGERLAALEEFVYSRLG
jgi:hypothetical protein